jgi:hypothetical protein
MVANQAERFLIALYKSPRGNHFGHIKTATEFSAEQTERSVCDASHRRQDHRGLDRDFAVLKSRRRFQLRHFALGN